MQIVASTRTSGCCKNQTIECLGWPFLMHFTAIVFFSPISYLSLRLGTHCRTKTVFSYADFQAPTFKTSIRFIWFHGTIRRLHAVVLKTYLQYISDALHEKSHNTFGQNGHTESILKCVCKTHNDCACCRANLYLAISEF